MYTLRMKMLHTDEHGHKDTEGDRDKARTGLKMQMCLELLVCVFSVFITFTNDNLHYEWPQLQPLAQVPRPKTCLGPFWFYFSSTNHKHHKEYRGPRCISDPGFLFQHLHHDYQAHYGWCGWQQATTGHCT